MDKRKLPVKSIRAVLYVIIILLILGIALFLFQKSFPSAKDAADYIHNMGWIGPFLVILIIILEVVVAPVPGSVIAVASGYAFGPFLGTIYSYTGNVIGSLIAFYLSRKYGRALVEQIISKKRLNQYDAFISHRGKIVIWLAYLFPVLPSDLVSFASGLTAISRREFIFIVCLGFLPNMILLNYFGYAIFDFGFSQHTLITGGIILISVTAAYIVYRHLHMRSLQKPK